MIRLYVSQVSPMLPYLRYDHAMTADELHDFILAVRAQADEALARRATVDPVSLPPDLRDLYEQQRTGWGQLRALTEDQAVELHQAACEHAGRELTQDEARALLTRQ